MTSQNSEWPSPTPELQTTWEHLLETVPVFVVSVTLPHPYTSHLMTSHPSLHISHTSKDLLSKLSVIQEVKMERSCAISFADRELPPSLPPSSLSPFPPSLLPHFLPPSLPPSPLAIQQLVCCHTCHPKQGQDQSLPSHTHHTPADIVWQWT